jgi:tetratricopeptide (TPR) repeat protein
MERYGFSKMRRVFFFFILCAALVPSARAQILPLREQADLFFSIERIAIKPEISYRLISRAGSRVQKDIAEFAGHYASGLTEYSRGDFLSAASDFKQARGKWPEYFYADFAVALSYESAGDNEAAARYYKSYLNKLEAYRKGHYGISAPLIMSFSSGPIEDHDYAYSAVKRRLLVYDIDLAQVRPAGTPGGGAAGVIMLFAVIAITGFVIYATIPLVKKRIREKNPPAGFWVCRGCGAYVPDLSFECQECGRTKPAVDRKKAGEKQDEA